MVDLSLWNNRGVLSQRPAIIFYTMDFIDTHFHLDSKEYPTYERQEIVQRALGVGVTRQITIGTNLRDSARNVQLAQEYNSLFATVGLHPHDVVLDERAPSLDDSMEQLGRLARERRVVAIGECGLDYSREGYDRAFQVALFERQLDVAMSLSLPVVLHIRDAHSDAQAILRRFSSVRAVVHCFTADVYTARPYVEELGLSLSFTGIITFGAKKVSELEEVVRWVPNSSYMLETDAPYLAPHPYRGKRNEPAHVVQIAEKAALLRGQSLEDVARHTTENAERLFGL